MTRAGRRRSIGLRWPAFGVAGITTVFLLWGPGWERARMLEALERPTDAQTSMRTLCRTEPGVRALHALLASAELERVLELTKTAAATDCLFALRPQDLARHHLHLPGEQLRVDHVVGLGSGAIDPAIEALEFGAPVPRRRASLALVGLAPQMSNNQKYRAGRRLAPLQGAEADTLRTVLGIAPKEVAAPKKIAPVSKPTAPEVQDFKLGGGGLRLKLDGFDAPAVREPGLRLAPEDRPPGGVLYRKGATP